MGEMQREGVGSYRYGQSVLAAADGTVLALGGTDSINGIVRSVLSPLRVIPADMVSRSALALVPPRA